MNTGPASAPAQSSRTVKVLDSQIAYHEVGQGATIVFLHGNPTSSHLWRGVAPRVCDVARCLMPDLIGMGASGKPDIAYRFVDHARYLEAWFDALGLRDVVLVGHDWGGALALDWATHHPERVRGVVLLETFLRPTRWADWPPQAAELFRTLRTPGAGEQLVLDQNFFIDRALAAGVIRTMTPSDLAAYAAPYPDRASRRPLLQWPREIPIDGAPADVEQSMTDYDAWLATSGNVPKLLLAFQAPSVLGSPAMVEWARGHAAALEVATLSAAGHHAPEDVPDEIGDAIRGWLVRHALAGGDAASTPHRTSR